MSELIAIDPNNWAVWASMALVGTMLLGIAWIVAVRNEWRKSVARVQAEWWEGLSKHGRNDWREITKDSVIECVEVPTKDD